MGKGAFADTFSHACTHSSVPVRKHDLQKQLKTYTHIYTHTHTCTHAYTHAHTYKNKGTQINTKKGEVHTLSEEGWVGEK